MATRLERGGASALPDTPLHVALAVIPSLPRPVLARLVQRAIDRLDEIDGDADLELTDAEDDWVPRAWSRNLMAGPGCIIADSDRAVDDDPCDPEEGAI